MLHLNYTCDVTLELPVGIVVVLCSGGSICHKICILQYQGNEPKGI